MKYYSELTKHLYDSEEELKKAEKEQKEKALVEKQKAEARKADYEKVKEAYKLAEEQKQKADQMLLEFTKKYSTVHVSRNSADIVDLKEYADNQINLITAYIASLPFLF